MLRPVLAFVTLCVAAFVLAPTVASVHASVESLNIHRDLPWRLWKWDQTPEPPKIARPDCGHKEYHLVSSVVGWPARIDKNETFQVKGTVTAEETGKGAGEIDVEVFLNATKEKPGQILGHTVTDADGSFAISALVPSELSAARYHIVAHALEQTKACKHFIEGYSDPETDVTSNTTIVLDQPEPVVIGHQVNVTGKVLDGVGAPVRDSAVSIRLDGQTERILTDGSGQFVLPWNATRAGNATVNVAYAGTKYYAKSEGNTTVEVLPEDVEILGYGETHPLAVERSASTPFQGIVYLVPGTPRGPLTLTFEGIGVASCLRCDTLTVLTTPQDAQGDFRFTILAPPPQAGATFNLTVTGGGLQHPHVFHGALEVPVYLTLNATDTGLFSRGYHGNVSATDEAGMRLPGPVALAMPPGWMTLSTDVNGTASFEGRGSCGTHTVQAYYNGTSPYRSAIQEDNVSLCGFLSFIPPWLLALSWWAWTLIAFGMFTLWFVARNLYQRHAPTLTRGPPLRLALARQADEGPSDVAGIGEEVLLVATLDAPLPPGHRLRMGHHRKLEWRDVQAAAEASFAVTPHECGDLPLRAEIVNEKGRVVTRRTVTLRTVRYAEEIETRYRALKRSTLEDASDLVSPREFESWLRTNAPPDLDPLVAKRLVGVFEEADYGPREAGRAEFLAFLSAERSVQPPALGARGKGVRSRA